MKTLYLDLSMGAAGDMISAALLELCEDSEAMMGVLNSLGIPDVTYEAEKKERYFINGTHLNVRYKGEAESECHHHHNGYHDISALIGGLNASETVKKRALEIYGAIAAAEAKVHGREMENIHFHELGTMDAVADVMAACVILEYLKPDKIVCSPLRLGYGTVRCAHGILPVPAPATAELICGIPAFAGDIEGELCTPTGAAIIKSFADEFSQMPELRPDAVGIGMGTKDFGRANFLRAIIGETAQNATELVTVVDDMSPEDLGYAMEKLRQAGALDVCWEAVGMKKSRPGMRLCCLCRVEDRGKMLELIFRHTSTIGVRELMCSRYVLKREMGYIETPWGPVRVKKSSGYGVIKTKPENDDLTAIAQKSGKTVEEIKMIIAGGQSDA